MEVIILCDLIYKKQTIFKSSCAPVGCGTRYYDNKLLISIGVDNVF